ncbi:hypothetical protein L914_13642 [Phytophthora nicotianae]|uniref:Uncharacterized protein n=1 Tax=Phytophthora nicotianae TaxID=4792 RepID=W2MY54_PHYNI|nr:hypothetical protein L914_13642 [Phytophthora nicotianae]
MSSLEACMCSLQTRLHQVENARSREMKAHGELVQKFECDLETRRASEAELRLTVAKLRADKCRLEAELSAAHTKARNLLEQLDAQSLEIAKRESTFKAFREESDRQLQVAHDKCAYLIEEKQQLSLQLSDARTCFENAKHENELLFAKSGEQSLREKTQTAEIEKLSTQLVIKQQEIEAGAVRTQLALNDFTRSREQQDLMQGRIQTLERDVNHALVTRNRAIHWRRKRQEMWDNRFVLHGAFLVWMSTFVQARQQFVAKVERRNNDTRARLQDIKKEAMTCFSQAREACCRIRQACANERKQILFLRDEIIKSELPKLLALLESHQRNVNSQQERLELQLKSQRECAEQERERYDMLLQDAEQRTEMLIAAHQSQLRRHKQQQRSIFQAFATKRRREFHRRVFSAWKELYLRSVVGQATHTAMVFQTQPSQLSTLELLSPMKRRESQSWAMPASIRPISRTVQRLQLEKQNFDDCLQSPMSEPTTPIDAMWRKWRRVDGRAAGRGLKYRSFLNSPSKSYKIG